MPRRALSLIPPILALLILWGLPGCSRKPTPEDLHAERLFARATTAFEQGDPLGTRPWLDSAILLDTRLRNTRRLADGHRLLGRVLAAAASFDSALSAFRMAAELYRETTDRTAGRMLALDIASVQMTMGEARQAYETIEEALRLAGVFRETASQRELRRALVPVARRLERNDVERDLIRILMRDSLTLRNLPAQAELLLESGSSGLQRGEIGQALEDLQRARDFAEAGRDTLLALRAFILQARAFTASDRPAEALMVYRDGLARADAVRNAGRLRQEMLVRVGNIYCRGRQYVEAMRFYRAALKSAQIRNDKPMEGLLFALLGFCERESGGSIDKALTDINAATDVFSELALPSGLTYALLNAGLAQERAGRPEEAVRLLSRAASFADASVEEFAPGDLVLECEAASTGQSATAAYESLTDLLVRLGRADEALWYADRLNGLIVHRTLASFSIGSGDETLNALLREFRHQRALAAGADRVIRLGGGENGLGPLLLHHILGARQRGVAGMQAIAARVAAHAPAAGAAVQVRSISAQEIQQHLAPEEGLLTWIPGRTSVMAILLRPQGSAGRLSSISRDELNASIEGLTRALASRYALSDSGYLVAAAADSKIMTHSAALFAALLRPVLRDLEPIRKLLIVLPPSLSAVPIHALRPARSGSGEKDLLDRFELTYLPAASAIRLPGASPDPVRDVVALGHAGSTTWDVEYELRDIRAFFKDARFYFGRSATIDALRREKGDLLHLAAPFSKGAVSGSNAAVMLSDGKAFNTTTEVHWGGLAGINRFPAIIVSDLSGTGATVTPAFPMLMMMGGARTVVVQSYPPSRKTKKIFTEVVYTAAQSGLSSRQVFIQAQRELASRPESSAQHLWAPFFVFGR